MRSKLPPMPASISRLHERESMCADQRKGQKKRSAHDSSFIWRRDKLLAGIPGLINERRAALQCQTKSELFLSLKARN
eukprot:6894362-Pyramimonas_sp.AAC.1